MLSFTLRLGIRRILNRKEIKMIIHILLSIVILYVLLGWILLLQSEKSMRSIVRREMVKCGIEQTRWNCIDKFVRTFCRYTLTWAPIMWENREEIIAAAKEEQ